MAAKHQARKEGAWKPPTGYPLIVRVLMVLNPSRSTYDACVRGQCAILEWTRLFYSVFALALLLFVFTPFAFPINVSALRCRCLEGILAFTNITECCLEQKDSSSDGDITEDVN